MFCLLSDDYSELQNATSSHSSILAIEWFGSKYSSIESINTPNFVRLLFLLLSQSIHDTVVSGFPNLYHSHFLNTRSNNAGASEFQNWSRLTATVYKYHQSLSLVNIHLIIWYMNHIDHIIVTSTIAINNRINHTIAFTCFFSFIILLVK